MIRKTIAPASMAAPPLQVFPRDNLVDAAVFDEIEQPENCNHCKNRPDSRHELRLSDLGATGRVLPPAFDILFL
jgi:hypothetical protein